ncbi:Sugar kinase of the NBD/HSP70 family, may contain an N-terminal HTH domain [Actinokineospora alba]|uniref:Sugar kinase of the NBD/HSP70 family, may contain an N-terminal HTH domain n=1 Tax=Actinokineospora alba TaxID=504798 RepID=A0A1H0G7Q0_9PSEU|nr:ROK family transcriptional regulator [Actinokineospora alba]TDP69795.1 putative NBD/HSP70 family sugar kinase [Actinokineospora alba]SDI08535.1 Sugar kinase of the NBD/HSP70 family, may contain an N-terminal HTH domain [Actinokineospora alba]SDO02871.1 Sugar kinase of the NBD/HSP70 family, may contain an N-terminal HTH domain [Actinokineospora alba]
MRAVSAPDRRRLTSAAVMLRAVLEHGPTARSTIARLTGLSPAAVTRQFTALADLGLITEAADALIYRGVGRPHIPVDIDLDRHLVLGIHIAHDHSTLAALDLRGRIRAQRRLPHASTDPARVLAVAARELTALRRKEVPGRIPLGLGVAVGGWVDPDDGVLVHHASLDWHDVPVRSLLTADTGLPVRLDSHARALARAEQLFGAVRGQSSVVHLFVGNVVDAAIVTSGEVHRGPRSAAGDVAHLALGDPTVLCPCGRRGCLEATVSDRGWAARAMAEGIIDQPSIVDLVAAARAGKTTARESLAERARTVGRAAAMLFDILNPEVLVVTDYAAIELPGYLQTIRGEVGRPVRGSSFPADSVLGVAAGAALLGEIYADPLSLPDGVPFSGRT